MPVYNAEPFLSEALSSILSQTFSDFELICIDDGSTDNSLNIINHYGASDKRIKVVTRENKGLVSTLNEALSLARYDYIARMDADDICDRLRLEKQYLFLKNNPQFAVVGCSYEIIDEYGGLLGRRYLPANPFFVKNMLIFGSSLCHPSVMFNKGLLKENLFYNNYSACEDLELWFRLASDGYLMTNLSKLLFKYRITNTSISRSNKSKQIVGSAGIAEKFNPGILSFNVAERIYSKKMSFRDMLSVSIKMIRAGKIREVIFFASYFCFKYKSI